MIALVPYGVYLLFGGNLFNEAGQIGSSAYNARLLVNTLVAVFIGGPHMYATFTRTMMNPVTFNKKKNLYIITSLLVPLFVFGMAVFSYESYVWLLTVFFGMASIHALHQIVWMCGAYDQKSGKRYSRISKLIDYGVVFSSLYPVAIWRMTQGNFKIGPISLKINELVLGWDWLAILAFGLFFVMLGAFVVKSYIEWKQGVLHYGKMILITVTVNVMFWMMFLPNIDTAAQGINTWHSFQYLALTWWAHKLAERRDGNQRRFLHFWRDLYNLAKKNASSKWDIPRQFWLAFLSSMRKIDGDTGWSSFYLLTMAMLPVSSVIVIVSARIFPQLHAGQPGSDEVYTYMGLLSILLVHYVHDGLLYTDPEDIVEEDILLQGGVAK